MAKTKKLYKQFFGRTINDLCVHDSNDVIEFANHCLDYEDEDLEAYQETAEQLKKIEKKMRKQGKHDSANQVMLARETIEDFYKNKEK